MNKEKKPIQAEKNAAVYASIVLYKEAIKKNKNDAESRFALAEIYSSIAPKFAIPGLKIDNVYALQLYEEAGALGHQQAQRCAALLHFKGVEGVPINYVRATHWFEILAIKGDLDAQYNLGACYLHGLGVTADKAKAFGLIYAAAKENHPLAVELLETNGPGTQYTLGQIYLKNAQDEKDDVSKETLRKKAFSMYQKASENNHVEAQFSIAVCYLNGLGVDKNPEKAAEFFIKGAEQEHMESQVNIAELYNSGLGVTKNFQEAFRWYVRASRQNHPKLGMPSYRRSLYETCFLIVNNGNTSPELQCTLADFYRDGFGVQQDNDKAYFYYKAAADQNYAPAQYELGHSYENGLLGLDRSTYNAFYLYLEAAEPRSIRGSGYAKAQYRLGVFYRDGIESETTGGKLPFTAFRYFELSANQNYVLAEEALGAGYQNAGGVVQDLSASLIWFKKAAEKWAKTVSEKELALQRSLVLIDKSKNLYVEKKENWTALEEERLIADTASKLLQLSLDSKTPLSNQVHTAAALSVDEIKKKWDLATTEYEQQAKDYESTLINYKALDGELSHAKKEHNRLMKVCLQIEKKLATPSAASVVSFSNGHKPPAAPAPLVIEIVSSGACSSGPSHKTAPKK